MGTLSVTSHSRKVIRDMLAGVAAFALIAVVMLADTPSAGAAGLPPLEAAASHWLPLSLLALVFSALLAFNLVFFRHLRRAYAPPRRKIKQSGP